ncbi:E3 ubiquitin-protein ligase-like protein poe isoform X3 [Haemaphysalis longicornis]
MASASSGPDWFSNAISILSSNLNSLNKSDLQIVIKTVIQSDGVLLAEDEEFREFRETFVALSAHVIATSATSLSRSQVATAAQACSILLRVLLRCLKRDTENVVLLPNITVVLMAGLCIPNVNLPTKAELGVLSSVLKSAKVPPSLAPKADGAAAERRWDDARELRQLWLNPSSCILEQLSTPLLENTLGSKADASSDLDKDLDLGTSHIIDPGMEAKNFLLAKNVVTLQRERAGDILLDVCLSLPSVVQYTQGLEDVLLSPGAAVPDCLASSVVLTGSKSLFLDVALVCKCLSLPVLEPLGEARLQRLARLALGCGHMAVAVTQAVCVLGVSSTGAGAVAAAQNVSAGKGAPCWDEEGHLAVAARLVEACLDIYNVIASTMRSSTRAGGHVLQNLHVLTSWMILRGLQVILSVNAFFDRGACKEGTASRSSRGTPDQTPTRNRDQLPGLKQNLLRLQQGFGVLPVALANQVLSLLTSVFGELRLEAGASAEDGAREGGPTEERILTFLGNINTPFSAWKCVRVLMQLNLPGLLFDLVSVSYRKAGMLKRIQKHPADGDNFSTSDSNTFYEEDFSSSDDSSADEDDDSEPILGHWFEETLAPREHSPAPGQLQPQGAPEAEESEGRGVASLVDGRPLIPDKEEPHGYIILATKVLNFVNAYLVNFEPVQGYLKSGIGMPQMVILAGIIKDLDRETCKSTIGLLFGASLGQLYEDFSRALARFIHNILATGLLEDAYQDGLLTHLNINPWIQKEWPLQIYWRTLSVLAQVLLLRQQKDKDDLRSENDAACILIFRLVLNTMQKAILSSHVDDNEDMNVEHTQLLLFLFHNLQLMQKKVVLLNVAKTIINVAPVAQGALKDIQIIYISRLLHIFEYLIKNLYDAPASLVDQVQANLFTIHGAASVNLDSETTKQHGKLYFPCKEVEDNFAKNSITDVVQGAHIRPKFYHLMILESGTQDVPKLDGFACSFLLASPDVLSYSELYSAVLSLLWIGAQCDAVQRPPESPKLSYLGAAAVQYCFGAVWRLLLSLPPSVQLSEALATGNAMLDLPHILHAIVWVSRFGHKNFNVWIKDSLVKQGMTAQRAESTLHQVTSNASQLLFDVRVFKQLASKQLGHGPANLSGPVSRSQLPHLMDLFVLEALIAKLQVALDVWLFKPLNEDHAREVKEFSTEIFPILLRLIKLYNTCIRWSLLLQAVEPSLPSGRSETHLRALDVVLRMTSRRCPQISSTVAAIVSQLPPQVDSALDFWNAMAVNVCNWRNDFANDSLPSESYIAAVQVAHFAPLSANPVFSISAGLKRILQCIVRFSQDVFSWTSEESLQDDLVQSMLPLLLDATTESQADFVMLALEGSIGSSETEEFAQHVYEEMLYNCYELLTDYAHKDSEIPEPVFHECLKFIEGLLDKYPGKRALERVFAEKDIWNIMVSAAEGNLGPTYGVRVLKFFVKVFLHIEKNSGDVCLEEMDMLMGRMHRLTELDTKHLQSWLSKLVTGGKGPNSSEEASAVQESRHLLPSLATYIIRGENKLSAQVAGRFLTAFIEIAAQLLSPTSDGVGFSELMSVMATLARAGAGAGHLQLFGAATQWLVTLKRILSQKEVLCKLEDSVAASGRHQVVLMSAVYVLKYVAEVVSALKMLAERPLIVGRVGAASPPLEVDAQHPEADSDWADEMGPEDEESGGEDSDEDSLCNKLCTFTMTQKEFMNQHWYHCHTCRMVDGVGVCTICAKVCHKDHDVTYAKFGSFFCDCGAKEDGTCQALVKRNPQASADTGPGANPTAAAFAQASENVVPSSMRRRASSPVQGPAPNTAASAADPRPPPAAASSEVRKDSEELMQQMVKDLEPQRGAFIEHIISTNLVATVLELIQLLMPAIIATYNRNSPIGSSARAQKALADLHTREKLFEHVDHLMVPTLGSQEGAFENVRMNYSGEQGQTIRQLLSAHMIRRVAMCCLASPHGKRQHLAVSHEKGKITLLQLSALLKQADSSKRKLTITRLASAPVPFTVLSITGNPCNEDFLAVCGLKDCHVLTFTSSGSVSEHLVLHPQLESGNYIIKAMWLPGSQTELALVTADFVKVYDLSVDATSAQFFFLVPTGRLRDCCFVCPEDGPRQLLLMSSTGYVYCQPLVEESSARHGPFYVTSVLDVQHPDIKDAVGTLAGGGVSIYYSHVLQLLFLSYANGKSFMACMPQLGSEITDPVLIQLKPSTSSNGSTGGAATASLNVVAPATTTATTTTTTAAAGNATGGGNSSSSKPTPQPLCQWSEVPNHPGLILALMQFSNNPLVLMIKPGTVLVQEIKILTAKSKITDLVAIRHPTSSGEMRTTLILLCEDGSLRIYMASQEQTGYWLTPAFQPATIVGLCGLATSALSGVGAAGGATGAPRPSRRKKSIRGRSGPTTLPVSFPVDFFEHCAPIQDVEFGGNDLLQIYNAQQVKHRLNTTGMYVACTKPGGLTLEVTNTDTTLVMVGVRVLVGSQDIQRAPSTVELFGRSHPLILTRSRWYDFPFTREESLSADKKHKLKGRRLPALDVVPRRLQKMSIFFGPSSDPSCVTMVDSVKVYGKSKEAFGWPEESDEFTTNVGIAAPSNTGAVAVIDPDGISSTPLPLTALDRLTKSCLEMLDDCFSVSSLVAEEGLTGSTRSGALDVATRLLTLPTPPTVHQQVRALLAALHPTRTAYTSHRDQALLSYVLECLNNSSKEKPPFQDLDGEAFYRLVAIIRGVACARPANLVQFAESQENAAGSAEGAEDMSKEEVLEERGLPLKVHIATNTVPPAENSHFLHILTEAFWHLHRQRPQNPALAPISKHGLVHVEATVQALVEVMYAFVALDMENVGLVAKLFARLLLCEDTVVSFAAKQAIIRVLRPKTRKRKVFIPRNTQCSTPGDPGTEPAESAKASSGTMVLSQPLTVSSQPLVSMPGSSSSTLGGLEVQPQASLESQADVESHFDMLENMDAVVLLGGASGAGSGGAFPPLLDIPPDADDETMVELAIALSLQDQPGQSEDLNLRTLNSAGGSQGPSQRASSIEGGHYSDTTASAGASDDEGSTAATDGSTLRTSPAEQQGGSGAGSESGGSGADSMTGEPNVSGRSSAYGDNALPEGGLARSETSSVGLPPALPQEDPDAAWGLHALRCALLDRLLRFLPQLRSAGGVRAIPFMQVILMLSSDLDSEDERDRATLDCLLSSLIGELDRNVARVVERSPSSEEQLIVMRLLSIMMSRIKSSAKASANPSDTTCQNYCSTSAAVALHASGIVDHCLQVLGTLLEHWKGAQSADSEAPGGSSSGSTGPPLLKPHPASPPPDMSPFFLRQYVKGHANDVFEAYPQLLTEMALRLPYQVKKVWAVVPPGCVAPSFGPTWYSYLCEYMMVQQTPFIRRQVRKLLLFLCGSKEKYRQLRDLHALESHLTGARAVCGATPAAALPYDALILVVEHLKACAEVATSRTANWQRYCQRDSTVLPFLFQVSFQLDDGVASIILQLLQCALCGSPPSPSSSSSSATQQQGGGSGGRSSQPPPHGGSPFKQQQQHRRSEREASEEADESSEEESQCALLAQQVHGSVERPLLGQFVLAFLLECNSTAVRWQAHSLLHQLHRHSQPPHREALLALMWDLWPQLPSYGRKAAQFVDLLGYFTLKSPQPDRTITEKALAVLHQQNQLLSNHPNSSLYNSIRGLVEMDGYYLESEPCLVCNNPEVAYANIKLSAIKVDSRFTTSTQIVKLVGSHTVSRIVLRIGDLKRSKMVRAINIYYNNRSVQSVVELKNRPAMWHRAKRCSLAAGQTELKMDFPLPIVACNLMIEYADFYENVQASSETLQCPRCSASVPANPGVCANCGENVFQCHKCRAINYDEKDPFLCNSCGFCKYAKFDYTLTAKPCCAVDPIEGEEDRKKAVASINALLEKADKVYRQLMAHKPALELLLLKVQEQSLVDRALEEEAAAAASTVVGPTNQAPASATPAPASSASAATSSMVNRSIQQLAQKYCTECKASFDELSKIVQKVLASRKELVEYEHKQKDGRTALASAATPTLTAAQPVRGERPSPGSLTMPASNKQSSGRCYGCASAAVEHCITLLRALATSVPYRQLLCERGLIGELVEHNLRQGWSQVGQLVCLLTRDNPEATGHLNSLLMERISLALLRTGATTAPQPHGSSLASSRPAVVVGGPDLPSAVRHEVALLALSLQKEDACWEQRLRCVMQLFLMGISSQSPIVLESITLPCLKMLQNIIKPDPPITKRNKDKSIEELATVRPSGMRVAVDLKGWLDGDPVQTYSAWKGRCLGRPADTLSLGGGKRQRREDVRARFLVEKYGLRWRQLARRGGASLRLLVLLQPSHQSRHPNWLRQVLFNPSCRQARTVACTLVKALCQVPSRCREMLDLLTTYLDELGTAGESGAKFMSLYQSLIAPDYWKHYLAIKGLLPHLGDLITSEIEQLGVLEETTLNADLSQGFALKMLTELLASFIAVDALRQQYKSRLVGCVLNGYLCLRKLVVQRTKLVDETQERLLALLEEMTTGTASETEAFMAVCVATLGRYPLGDVRTPVFIFERLCSLIHPEENELGEFLVTLEKDPQQEDFLQGRMLGNPYSSHEPGMGPLMRDLKNKVCQDCELVALLEDDNGMELLVCNKIMSLDLPVKEVYRKVWCAENGESEAMRVVYRMRGLLGDATEEFVESLEAKAGGPQVDEEQLYQLARVMGTCGGLEAMLERLAAIDDLARGRPLLTVLLKLFGLCVKVRSNRQRLLEPPLRAVARLLGALRLLLGAPEASLAEQLLATLEAVLAEGAAHVPPLVPEGVTRDDITFLLAQVGTGRPSPRLLQLLMRVVPFLTLTDEAKMEVLINHFKRQLNFSRFDLEHTPDDDVQLECFCNLSAGIERNDNGNRLKNLLVARGIVQAAIRYLLVYSPPAKSSLLSASENWKEFTSKPALKYVLRILTGLSRGHEMTQLLVSAECIPIIHRLEQVSSDEHVGSLAENLMEALKENPNVAQKIEEVRKQTRDEKKRLAMAMREKQLGELGMRTNEKGQVTAKSSILKQMEDLGEELGLVCIICREGYKFQPSKVLGIYTFTKRCNLEEFEAKPRKTPGYSTVTHFNIVHVDCHMAAVRHARGRDEWESAALQNANTKCNGLLPLWGPQVPESAFASCLARHNTYIQDCTGHLDVGYVSTLHDLKLLLSRFAFERSFSEDSGGGGPQSNMHLIPYLLHMVLYVINTTRCVAREDKNLSNFLEMSPDRQVENCYESEGPCYWATMALVVWSPSRWRCGRVALVRRMLVLAHARHLSPQGTTSGGLADAAPREFAVYRPYLCYLAMVDGLYNIFKRVSCSHDESWSVALADYIRHSDQALLELGDKLLRNFEEQVLTCQSFMEYCDVMGLLCEIPNPDAFLQESLQLRV